jgi:hypothetical protein
VDVFVDRFRKVIVYHVFYASDVEAPSGDIRRDDDVHPAGLEVGEGNLALSLKPVAVDGGSRKSL